MIHVLMVGVGKKRVGGMSAVAEVYLHSSVYNKNVKMKYIPTSTNGPIVFRIVYMLIGYIRIIAHLLFTRIDLVHVHMAEKGSTFRKGVVVKTAKKMGKKVVIHLHAGAFVKWYNSVDVTRKRKIQSIFECSDAVVVLGKYWKKELAKIVPSSKIVAIYNGASIPTKNNYSVSSRNITYFGVLRKEKGTYDLLESIKKIDSRLDKSVKVLLCGNDLEGDFKKKIAEYNLENRVRLLGWVSDDKKKDILKASMINVLPSYFEGLSMTIIEGMSYGIPTVTTNISTMPEILGEYKYLITPGDASTMAKYILELTNNPRERADISNYVYSRAKRLFSEESFISNTLMLYNRIVGKK